MLEVACVSSASLQSMQLIVWECTEVSTSYISADESLGEIVLIGPKLRMFCATHCITALENNPMLFISVQIKSTYTTSFLLISKSWCNLARFDSHCGFSTENSKWV